MGKLRIFVALLLAVTVLIGGCRGEPQTKGTFIEGASAGDAETLNWILAADGASFDYAGHTLDSLVTFNTRFEVQLRHLARHVMVSEDGLVYTITIRDALRWSDGSKVTSEDYVYTLNNLMFSDWLNYNYKSDWQETVDGESLFVKPEVVDDTTFTITRQTVEPEFIYTLYPLKPYPKAIAQKYEGDIKAFTQAEEFNQLTYTGNLGPYKFSEWIRNDKYVVVRNPEYYLGKDTGAPYFEKYEVKIFGTSATRQAALEAGDITSTGIDPLQVSKFKEMAGVKVYTVPTSSYLMLAYNLRANGWEGFKEKKVRQALSMSIGKEILIQSVLLGFGDPAFSFIPKPSPWYTEEGLAKYGVGSLYDKQKAMEMLYEAGYGTKREDGAIEVKGKDGKPLKFTILTNSGNKIRESTAFLIRQELSDLGIEVELKLVPWATLLRQYLMNKVPGPQQEPRFNNGPEAVSEQPWDLIVMGFNSNPLSPSGQHIIYTAEGGLNFWGYFNEEVGELFRRVRSKEALEEEARRVIYTELSKAISEDQPVDFLAFQAANPAFLEKVKGIEPGINMGYNYHTWYFEE
ncbi:ABC transporter substrate-binding protein [Chloroflexota bacterium]